MGALEQAVDVWQRLPLQITTLGTVVLALLLAFLGSRALGRIIDELRSGGHLAPLMAKRLQGSRRLGVLLVTLLVLLQITGLFHYAWALLSTALAAIAIGFFAAWSILSNATCALLIVAFRPFRVGDVIELVEPQNATSFKGQVVDMNLMYTVLEQREGDGESPVAIHIPNNLFLQKLVRTHGPVRLSQVGAPPFFRDSKAPE